MKNQYHKLATLFIAVAVLSACDRGFDDPVEDANFNKGSADFSKFVSIGDSLTAGYADGALYLSGQQNSYPSILAQQFAKVGGGTFTQPEVSDNLGGLLFSGTENPEFGNRLIFDLGATRPSKIEGTPTTEVIGSGLTGAFNNMGVPGAKSFHLVSSGYGNAAGLSAGSANPYFVRFATDPGTTVIADADVQQPSFFVLWIGNNDILSYATSGGVGVNQLTNIDPTTYGSKDITNTGVFAATYNGLVNTMLDDSSAAKGVLVSIPDISTIPYFTTVPFKPLPLDQVTADALNQAYQAYNAGIAAVLGDDSEIALRTITFTAGQNAVVILDEDLTDLSGAGLPSMRQTTAEDLLVLGSSAKIGTLTDVNDETSTKWGITAPLEDGDVLIPSEIAAVETARLAFNSTIEAVATANDNLLFFDVAALMSELSVSGVDYGTGFVNATYATGGAFSLDGVHPSARGYAVIANRMIDTINAGFGANVPRVDPGAYTTIFVK